MGGICSQLAPQFRHRAFSFPVHSGIPTSFIPRTREGGQGYPYPGLCTVVQMHLALGPSCPALYLHSLPETGQSSSTPCPSVFSRLEGLALRVESRKLAPHFVGPFPISRVINSTVVQLRLPRTMCIHPTFHVSHVKPVIESPLMPASRPSPLPRLVVSQPVYTVKRLLWVHHRERGLQYLVDWVGYGPEELSWALAADILDTSLMEEFLHPDQPGGMSRAIPRGGSSEMVTP